MNRMLLAICFLLFAFSISHAREMPKKGMNFLHARKLVINDGWKPFDFSFSGTEYIGSEKPIVKAGIKELQSCTVDRPWCLFYYKKNGECLNISTSGETLKEMKVAGIYPSCPSDSEIDDTQINLSGKTWTITSDNLFQLKKELLVILKQKESRKFYKYLLMEFNNSYAAIMRDGKASIGRWHLLVRNNELLLEHHQMPRIKSMPFFEANLVYENELWHVGEVREVSVKGRRQ